jgi:NAD(P)H-dependent FMN reductase
MRVEIISGSPRAASVTKRVAQHLAKRLNNIPELNVGLIDIRQNQWGAVENVCQGSRTAPSERSEIVSRVFDADAFILVTPEYNGSYSPALKNFLDHFPKQNEKVFGIATASPGAFGGMRAALQLQTLIYGLMGIGSPQMLIVPGVDSKFLEDGTLTDEAFGQSVDVFIERFLWLSRAVAHSRATAVIKKCA